MWWMPRNSTSPFSRKEKKPDDPEVRPEGREPLPDKAGESTLPSRSGGELIDMSSINLNMLTTPAIASIFSSIVTSTATAPIVIPEVSENLNQDTSFSIIYKLIYSLWVTLTEDKRQYQSHYNVHHYRSCQCQS